MARELSKQNKESTRKWLVKKLLMIWSGDDDDKLALIAFIEPQSNYPSVHDPKDNLWPINEWIRIRYTSLFQN